MCNNGHIFIAFNDNGNYMLYGWLQIDIARLHIDIHNSVLVNFSRSLLTYLQRCIQLLNYL
jgi:hypothetical protein